MQSSSTIPSLFRGAILKIATSTDPLSLPVEYTRSFRCLEAKVGHGKRSQPFCARQAPTAKQNSEDSDLEIVYDEEEEAREDVEPLRVQNEDEDVGMDHILPREGKEEVMVQEGDNITQEGYNSTDDEEMSDLDVDYEVDGPERTSDEERSIFLRRPVEQQEIQVEIHEIEELVPQLNEDYKIIDRLGTGTFSSVYKAIDLGYHSKWHNTTWHGHHPPDSSAHYQSKTLYDKTKVFVAVKRIYVTSSPLRIQNELSIMEDVRGCRHVSQLITAFRNEDQVVVVMPYHRNVDFRLYHRTLSFEGIQAYFRCMFRALRDIHSRGIIHRDLKPANFLFDPDTGTGTLVDFGLAQRFEFSDNRSTACNHTAPSRQYLHGRFNTTRNIDMERINSMVKDARQRSTWSPDRIGWPAEDHRPHSKANRAGTRGFRAPEVLLKCHDQSPAVDIWAAGIVLLFFLTGRFPIFQSTDDVEGLMEQTAIFGRKRMERIGILHNRTFCTNIPTIDHPGVSWTDFVKKLNPDLFPSEEKPMSPSFSPVSTSPLLSTPNLVPGELLDQALDLLSRCLDPSCVKRITSRGALYHPFLAPKPSSDQGATVEEDDKYFPHPYGEGVCADLHWKDDVTEHHCVKFKGRVKTLEAGEGIAIGNMPCEFHRDLEFDVEERMEDDIEGEES